jgi:hypothetical protein
MLIEKLAIVTTALFGLAVFGAAPAPEIDIDNAGFTAMEIVKSTKDPDAKWRAVRILGSLRYERAVPLLLKSLSDPHHYVRANAARALGDMRVASAARPLTRLLEKETNGGVIQQTSLALANLRHSKAVPALKAAAKHEDVQTRMWVLQAIGRLGGKKDVPFLARHLLDDPSSSVQRSAAEAIEQITGVDFGLPKRSGPSNPEEGIERARVWWKKNQGEFADKAGPDSGAQAEPRTHAADAIAALAKKNVQLERDEKGFVVHARLSSRSILLHEAIPHLKRLPKLAWLACNADNLTTDGFRQLSALRSFVEFEVHANRSCPPMPWKDLRMVRIVRLSGDGIDNTVLKAITEMPAVTDLHLNEITADADGLAHLKGLCRLEMLLIQKSNVTAEGVKTFSEIEKLKTLTLCGNRIGTAGFAHLGKLTRLEYLNLESTSCTDADVARLKPLTNLLHLDLGYNADLTDTALRHLDGLKKLLGIRLYETRVTDPGVAELKKVLPQLTVGK